MRKSQIHLFVPLYLLFSLSLSLCTTGKLSFSPTLLKGDFKGEFELLNDMEFHYTFSGELDEIVSLSSSFLFTSEFVSIGDISTDIHIQMLSGDVYLKSLSSLSPHNTISISPSFGDIYSVMVPLPYGKFSLTPFFSTFLTEDRVYVVEGAVSTIDSISLGLSYLATLHQEGIDEPIIYWDRTIFTRGLNSYLFYQTSFYQMLDLSLLLTLGSSPENHFTLGNGLSFSIKGGSNTEFNFELIRFPTHSAYWNGEAFNRLKDRHSHFTMQFFYTEERWSCESSLQFTLYKKEPFASHYQKIERSFEWSVSFSHLSIESSASFVQDERGQKRSEQVYLFSGRIFLEEVRVKPQLRFSIEDEKLKFSGKIEMEYDDIAVRLSLTTTKKVDVIFSMSKLFNGFPFKIRMTVHSKEGLSVALTSAP
jgi:hypothetical protein